MRERIFMVIFVIVLGTVSAGLLGGIRLYTQPRILKNEQLKIKTAILEVLGIPYSQKDIEEVFSKDIEKKEKEGEFFYINPQGEIAFLFSGAGLWGPIHGLVALKPDLKTIKRLKITHQEETPGLGGRIAEEDFLRQFENKKISPQIVFLPEGQAKRENEVDAITGATMTSKSLEELLNKEIKSKISLLTE